MMSQLGLDFCKDLLCFYPAAHSQKLFLILQCCQRSIILQIKMERLSSSSVSSASFPVELAARPLPFPLAQSAVKLEAESRPEAIYLNCSPALLPLIVETARQLCHKYLDSTSDRTVQGVLRGVERVGQNLQRSRGVRELVCAVLYCELKDFARMNQLSLKLFNRKYLAYQTLCKRQAAQLHHTHHHSLKIEEESCKSEDPSEKEEEEYDTHERMPSSQPIAVSSPKQAIELIFDGIFRSQCFQDSRREMITKMAQRCQQINGEVYQMMTWTGSRPMRLFYAVYARLKQLGMSVGFTRYRETVSAVAGLQLKRAHAHHAEKILKIFTSREENQNDRQQVR